MIQVQTVEKKAENAIKLEVVIEDKLQKKTKIVKDEHSIKKGAKENPSTKFTETVQLCCLTMTAGPGTQFGDYKIPQGVKCSVCGSGLNKSRM